MEMTLEQLKNQLAPLGYSIVNSDLIRDQSEQDFYLHQYSDYEQYKQVQIFHNLRKIDQVWADEATLRLVYEEVERIADIGPVVSGLCHGSRNGWEQKFLGGLFERSNPMIIGTDISESASQFENSVVWDFHDINPEWIATMDFVYTNSLDQSYDPSLAVETWLNQLKKGGLLFVEHTVSHSPSGAGEMDPFGAKPRYMPYLFAEWFGHQISLKIRKGHKANKGIDVWLFIARKLTDDVKKLPSEGSAVT